MKITREELQAIENHMSNIPAVAGMYTPVLIAWCRALLDDNADAHRRGAEAMREACAQWFREHDESFELTVDACHDVIADMPIPEEP